MFQDDVSATTATTSQDRHTRGERAQVVDTLIEKVWEVLRPTEEKWADWKWQFRNRIMRWTPSLSK